MSGVTHTLVIVLLVALFTFFYQAVSFLSSLAARGNPLTWSDGWATCCPFLSSPSWSSTVKKHNL